MNRKRSNKASRVAWRNVLMDRTVGQQRTVVNVLLAMFLPIFLVAVVQDFSQRDTIELIGDGAVLALLAGLLMTRISALSSRQKYAVNDILAVLIVFAFGGLVLHSTHVQGDASRFPWAFLVVMMAVYTLRPRIGIAFGAVFAGLMIFVAYRYSPEVVPAAEISALRARFAISLALTFSISVTTLLVWNHAAQQAERKRLFLSVANARLEREVEERERLALEARRSLDEKATLLKEVHHRVKNNMQIISSLLNLEAQKCTDATTAAHLTKSEARVRTIALVHESLYQSETIAAVNLRDYLEDLAGLALSAFNIPDRPVAAVNHVPEVFVSRTVAVPLGLIFNELVTNAVQHAFPDGRGGQIEFSYSRENGRVFLGVSDDGIGYTVPNHGAPPANLGLVLIHSLAAQIGAEISSRVDGGMKWTIKLDAVHVAESVDELS